jgi:hypothetical protein
MRRRLTFLLLFAGSTALSAADGAFEKTVPVPRSGNLPLGWTHQGCSVKSLTLRNYPDRGDIEDARRKDPGDKSWLWWEFNVANRSSRECRISLSVEVFDRRGNVVKSSDRKGSVSPGETDDDIRVSTLMKTLDVADSPKVRLRATIAPK